MTLVAALLLGRNNLSVEDKVEGFVDVSLPSLNVINELQRSSKDLVLIGFSLYGTTLTSDAFLEQRSLLEASLDSQYQNLQRLSVNSDSSQIEQLKKNLDNLFAVMNNEDD